jgi:hypothetical protein
MKTELKYSKRGPIARLVRRLVIKVQELFQPEEVEVTFTVEGKNVKYTYTKVQQKQIA